MFPILPILIGAIALIAGGIWIAGYFEKKRREALQTVAVQLGFSFSPKEDGPLLGTMQVFQLFNRGHSRKMSNVMQASTDLADIAIFDYAYTTGGGKNSQRHLFTVVAMQSDTLNLPRFTMRPEHFFDKIGSVIGLQDIDFPDHPEFSKSFVLKGDDETSIRRFFDAEMLKQFEAQKKISIESASGAFIYLQGGRKKPEQIAQFMEDGVAVFSAFLERQSR